MTRPPEETELTHRVLLETQLEINKDFKTVCALHDDFIARVLGIETIGLLPAWFGGGAIARRMNLVRTTSRLAVRMLTHTALTVPALVACTIYQQHCVKTHPRGPRLLFVRAQLSRYESDIKLRSKEQQQRMRESIKIWRRLSKQEPVYRNQNELSAWIEASGEVTKYLSRTYENASPDECYEAISRLERFYVIPAINKVYGVQLRDEIDLNRWVHSKTAKDGYFESEQEPSWSLKAPEKAEEFWDWFEDDKTGKPVVRDQDGAESGLTEQSVDSDSQLQALARETSPPEKKKQLRRKRKEIIESEQEKRS